MEKTMKRSKEKGRLYSLIYFICLAAFCITGSLLVRQMVSEEKGSTYYTRLNQLTAIGTTDIADSPSESLPELCQKLTTFSAEYPEAVLWLQIPGTEADYPVMLGEDNTYYLDHLPDGTSNALGSLFLDCRTDRDSTNWIIYGHNGSRQRMFGLLKQYQDPEFRKEYPSFLLASKDVLYTCSVFSVEIVDLESPVYQLDFQPREEDCRLVTLSTCVTWHPDKRLIVQAFLEKS